VVLIRTEPALGISAKVARGVTRGWTSRKCEEYWQSIRGQRQAEDFLKVASSKRAGKLLNLSRNQLRVITGLLTGHCHLKGHLLKLGLVDSARCDGCKLASETASRVVFDCEALAILRFKHLGQHFMKPGDLEPISISRMHFAQSAGLLNV
jgi:hypothetical protein